MSKTTKVIAALGVVAGLGVAALPAFTYAAEVAGQVQIDVVVPDAIAMTIEGNNDTTLGGVSVFTPATATEIGDYDTTDGTAYDAANLQTSGSKTELLPNAVSNDATFKSVITVFTNASGYSLVLEDGDDNNALVNGSATIPATSTTTLTAGTSAWGYKVGSSATDWLAVPVNGSAANIKANGQSVATGDETEVYYGVATSATQAAGTYTDTVVYTATSTNN